MSENTTRMKRSYTEEFIEEAVKLALSSPSISGTAKSLGIPEGTLHTWLQTRGKSKKSNKTQNYDELLQENRKLNKELFRLRQEKEILKKASAYFAQNQN
jgi:transposase